NGLQLSAGISLHVRQYGQVKIPFRRTVGRASATASLVVMLALSFAAPAAAAVELDQLQPAGLGNQSVQRMVQTFIAGKTGRLDHADLKLFALSGSLTVTVRQANLDRTPAVPRPADPELGLSGSVPGTNP